MSFFGKIKNKVKLGIGVVAVTVFGAVGGYFAYEKLGYEANVEVIYADLDHVVYAGDGGIETPQRASVAEAIRAYAPTRMRLLGDNCYDRGCLDRPMIQKHVVEPYGDFGPQHVETDVSVSGNHSSYALRSSERDFMIREFRKGPIGKVRYDNYYKMKVFNNACEISWESTVADVKIGDPPMQKRQSEFICKAVKDRRCEGKIIIGLTHQAAIGKGKRGNTKSSDYMKLDEKCIRNSMDYVLSGHEHTTLYSGKYGRAQYFIAGALAKLTNGYPGFLALDHGKIVMVKVDGPKTLAEDDED